MIFIPLNSLNIVINLEEQEGALRIKGILPMKVKLRGRLEPHFSY